MARRDPRRWARTIAAPEVQRLSNHGDYAEAFLLVRQALDVVPDDPHLRQLWLDVSMPAVVTTDPAGADVAFAAYRTPTTWVPLGRTPLNGVRIPRGLIRVRISKAGFQPIEGLRIRALGCATGWIRWTRCRRAWCASPEAAIPFGLAWSAALDDYWIDRFEVTNRQFKEFVDQGGYRRRDYWREPFIDGGRSVPWEEAVERFRDATGRPGPATWKSGTYPDGQADFPVGGVSWYEAAAYAAFAGKSLPTMHHWYRAAGLGRFADILTVSNFSGKGPAPVGSYDGLGPFGTYDMAGNVKEWCWTETNSGRFLAGRRVERAEVHVRELRCEGTLRAGAGLRLPSGEIHPAVAAGRWPHRSRFESLVRDARKEKPVGDDIFEVYRRQYAYDPAPLNAVVEATEETAIWREAHRRIRRRLWRRAHARASLPAEDTDRRRTRPSSSFRRETPSFCDRAATCRFAGGSSSSAADERSSTRCTKGPTSGRRLTRSDRTQNASSELRGREISDAPSTISRRDRISIGLVWRSTA